MRRHEKEITDPKEMEAVIRESRICRLGLSDGLEPYIVPVNFGYRNRRVYIHGAPKGRKIDLIRKNPRVCVEFDIDDGIIEGNSGCNWSMAFRSVIATGRAVILEDKAEKRQGLAVIMAQYSDGAFSFPDKAIAGTAVIRIDIDAMTGKRSPVEKE